MSGRFSRENFDRAGYERELAGLREAMRGPVVSAPVTAVELAELERLIRRYPDHARSLLAAVNGPDAAAAPSPEADAATGAGGKGSRP